MEAQSPRTSFGDTLREVAHVSWPIVIGMLSYTAMGVTDTLLVGWIGKSELAAVGLGTTAIFLVNSFFLGTLHGVKVISAQATGAGRHALAYRAGATGVVLGVAFGMAVLMLSLADGPIFAMMGGSQHVQALARDYFNVRVWAAPFWYVTIALCDYYQGTGDTKTPMKINLLANGLNIVLSLALIFGVGPIPAMGVEGAALATALASAIGMVALVALTLRRKGPLPRPEPEMARRIVKVGLPIGIHFVLGVSGFTVFTALLARMGEDELAANQIAIKIISLSFLPGHGISEAASVLTGQYVGRRDFKRAESAFHAALLLSVVVMGAFSVLFWLVPEGLIGLFQDDRRVLEIGRDLLLVAAVFQIFDAVAMTASGALNGTGDTRFTMIASVLASWLVMVPMAYLLGFVLEMGATGAWLGLTAEIIVLAAVMLYRFHSGAWQTKAVV